VGSRETFQGIIGLGEECTEGNGSIERLRDTEGRNKHRGKLSSEMEREMPSSELEE
jgi:hypothetical protein